MPITITALIFARNNADEIAECVQSARLLCDNITVIDIGSDDDTRKIAIKAGSRVTTIEPVEYVEPARAAGIATVKTDWVFILDADERMSEPLALEIKKTIQLTNHTHLKVPRKNIFARRVWLRHGGWWPDAQTRLFQTKAIKEWPARIHATPIIEGTMGHMTHAFLHYFHGDFALMVQKTIKYESIEASLLARAHTAAGTLIFMRKFAGELYRRLIKNRGYKDGIVGYMESVYQAYSKTITYLIVFEQRTKRTAEAHRPD